MADLESWFRAGRTSAADVRRRRGRLTAAVALIACAATAGVLGMAQIASASGGIHSSARLAQPAAAQVVAAGAWSPPKSNGVWIYDDQAPGSYASTIAAYNQIATSADHKITQINTYGSDLEDNGSSVYYTAKGKGFGTTAAYFAQLQLAPSLGGAPATTYTFAPIIDGRTDDQYLSGFNGLSAAAAATAADGVAAQVCADSRADGIQFDIEPFDLTSKNGQYWFYKQISKDFAGQHSGATAPDPYGCVDAAHPYGRYFSVFTFAKAIQPGTASASNIKDAFATGQVSNGYVIDSLYDLGTQSAGHLNDVPTYTALVGTEAANMKNWAGQLGQSYAYGIPASASAHEFTTCLGTCYAGADGTTGNPMLSYTTAAVAAINSAGAPTDPLFIGTNVWDLGAYDVVGSTSYGPSPAPVDVLRYLAANLPGAKSGSSAPDTQAPTAPTAVRAGTPTSSSIPISWTASTDNVGVSAYDVYLNGTLSGTASSTSYTATGLSPSTSYAITVKARDAAGNTSAASAAVSATTAAGSSSGANLLTNGGFETGSTAGWDCGGSTSAVTGQAVEGTYSVRLTPSATDTASCSQTVAVTAGQSYTLSAQLKSSSATEVVTVGVKNGTDASLTGTVYGTRTVTFTPSGSSVTIYVQAYKQQTGDTWADAVSLVKN